jgi:polyketide-type polyunsaturated fatty acid synthase PfaA
MQPNFNWSNNMSNEQNLDVIETEEDKKLNSQLQSSPIAIVGMASVFAETKNLEQFWDNIVESVNGIKDIPEDRWAIDDYYSSDKKAADKTYCKRGGFLPEIDFDPMEFGLPPNILELTDITQLMSLVVARDVLADAGISDEAAYDRDKIGITLGVGGGQKQIAPLTSRLQGPILDKVLKASGVSESDRDVIIEKYKKAYIPWEENSFPGMLGNVIAGRIANRFDFGGTNCVVDAACAGSLAAIKMAVSDLLEHRSEMMISGGVCCDNSPFMYMSFSKTPAFTDGDDIRPFDENSKGMMIGEGVGMIALKRLEDAERDGDKIYALIKGIGSSSDGRFKSIYAPRPSGQVKALKRAYEDAGFDPLTCGLIEAHGTGTKAGDAAEFSGLNTMFSENNDQKQHIALGSVKSQVGHTKAAAGTAGIIKAALALHHKVLPATINVDNPNPNLDIENSPLYINNETRPWMPRVDGIKRRAGVSSFGFGGTNFHFVLEEYKASHDLAYRINEVPQTLLISATDKPSLVSGLNEWLTKLSVENDSQAYVFNELVLTHPLKTPANSLARCGFVAKNADQAMTAITSIIKQLTDADSNEKTSWSKPTGIYYREAGLETQGKVVALFSGQGSQYVNMGRDLTCNFPTMLATSAQMDKTFNDAGLGQLSSTVFPIPVFSKEQRTQQDEELRLTQNAQPAIGTFSAGLFNTFKKAGLKIDFAAGHSFGELTALWAAGVVSDKDYMLLARSRGAAMAAPEASSLEGSRFDPGTMAAVVGAPHKVAVDIKDIDGVSIANYNSNNQVVIAGVTAQIEIAVEQLQKKGYKVVKLPVSAAFHTELVGHAQKPFADVIDSVEFKTPILPVFANGTAKAHSSNASDIKSALKNHILQSVHFNEEIDNLYDAGGRIFVEFGPKNVLTRLVDNILQDKNDVVTIAVNSNPKKSADLQLRLAAVEMAVLGLELDNIDPYSAQKRPLIAPKKSPLAMKLTGAAYVNPKTKKAFDDALNDGWKINAAEPKIIEKVIEKIVVKEVIKEVIVEKIVYVQKDGTPLTTKSVAINNMAQSNTTDIASSIERSVESFVNHQSQLLDVHQSYMQGPKEYAKTFQEVLATQKDVTELPAGLDKTLGLYHDFQSETLRVHETYLNNQTDNMNKMLSNVVENNVVATNGVDKSTSQHAPVARQTTAPLTSKTNNNITPVTNIVPISATIPVTRSEPVQVAQAVLKQDKQLQPEISLSPVASLQTRPALDVNKIQNVMLDVVAEKTGYPTEMLELSMDMEADLGIDSIKRVEILGAVQDEITDLPELNPEDLAELRTLGEIVDYMQLKAQSKVSAVEPVTHSVPVQTASIDLNKIQSVMMSVVAEKTGYPTEMLELSMDMEADLGIDSIKRVEILGAVQDEITDLPELNPEDLAELRTLGEIVDYMQLKAQSKVSAVEPVTHSVPVQTASIDLNKIQSVMMSVVAEKTGYPTEMLELSMDMEADLGIDSIKRVEILGAVQDEITDLPELNPEDLAELRTLGEIVDYMQLKASGAMQSKAGDVVSTSAPVISASQSPSIDLNKIQSVMLDVVTEKTGYPTEMLELSMDMEADLGIDSIKRVEILGAVQDEITDLPELNPEDLAELRTLGQIVEYMQFKAGSSTSSSSTANSVPVVSIDLNKIQSVMMSVVADKTGYPAEMLELGMDMEADLGIDSIKRVEILGAVQDEITDLPELNPEDLAELRSLGEIVDYMQLKASGAMQSKIGAVTSASEAISTSTTMVTEINNDFEPAPSSIVVVKHLDAVVSEAKNINGENLLLVDDGEGSAVRLADKLNQQGWSVTVLKPSWVQTVSSKSFPKSVNTVELEKLDEQELQSILATQATWHAVVYLQAKTTIEGIEYPQSSKHGLQLAFLLAKLTGLAKNKVTVVDGTLDGNNNNDARSSFLVLTRQGGCFGVQSNEQNSDLVQTGLTGLVKTLSHEWPNVFCRAIDVASKFGADKVANIVFDELNDRSVTPAEVGFNSNGRLTLVAEKTDSYALQAGNSIDEKSLFLVSGGAKGVTAHCVIRLAQTYKSKFILLGRSKYESKEPIWAVGIGEGIDEQVALKKAAMQYLISNGEKPTPVAVNNFIKPVLANREITKTLDAVQNAGGIAQYVSVDVTDSERVQNIVSPITDLWGDVTGIIHGAGVLADKFIEQKTLAEFDAVYSTKIDGLISMLSCTQQEKVKHLVLFSSAAGFYGNPGQSDYAIANDILNKSAYRFKALNPSAQVLSFNWGPWDGGMVTPELKRMFNDRGVYIIPLDAGAQLLVSELAADTNRCPQILVGNDMGGEAETEQEVEVSEEAPVKKPLVSRLTKNLLAANNAFFVDHQIGEHQVFPTVCAIAWMVESVESTYPDYQYLGLKDYKLFKGIIFDGREAQDYVIDLNLLTDEADQLSVEVKISSTLNNNKVAGKITFHYSAVLLLGKSKNILPVYQKALSALTSETHDLYDNGTLFHGETLQGISAINHCDENGLLLSCAINASVKQKQGEFDVTANNVFANDLVYQALLVWVRKQLGLGSLPTATVKWTVYQEVPVDQPFYLQLSVTANKRNKKVIADVQFISADKQILATITGAQVTASESLNDLFLKVVK